MAAKQWLPNQCAPLHLLYGPSDCCLCGARADLERFKAMVRDDMAQILPFLNERPHTQKLMAERYGVEMPAPNAEVIQ